MNTENQNPLNLRPGFKSSELYATLVAIFTMYGAPAIAFKLNTLFPALNLGTAGVLSMAGSIMAGVGYLVRNYVKGRNDHKASMGAMNYKLKMAKYEMLSQKIALDAAKLSAQSTQ